MYEFKDLIGNLIEVGNTVIVQDGSSLGLGRVSHVSKAGNLIIRECLSFSLGSTEYNRIINKCSSDTKVIVTNDPWHVTAAQSIKIKGE